MVSISLGLSPVFSDTGGGYNRDAWGARDTWVSISLRLSPKDSFSDEVFTTDSGMVVWA